MSVFICLARARATEQLLWTLLISIVTGWAVNRNGETLCRPLTSASTINNDDKLRDSFQVNGSTLAALMNVVSKVRTSSLLLIDFIHLFRWWFTCISNRIDHFDLMIGYAVMYGRIHEYFIGSHSIAWR